MSETEWPLKIPRDETMMAISITEFINGLHMPVEVYIRLTTDKYVLLAKPGQKLEMDQLLNFRAKKVSHLWIHKNEYDQITAENVKVALEIAQDRGASAEKKVQALSAAAENVFNIFDTKGFNSETFTLAKDVTQAAISTIEVSRDYGKILKALSLAGDSFVNHSLAVSFLSTVIAQALGWENKVTLEKLAMGGLIHDIGKRALPQEVLKKSKLEMNHQELQIYETHPFKGMEMLKEVRGIHDDLISIVYEHHETATGQGFPQRLRDFKMHPLARIVSLSDCYVNLIIKSPWCPQPRNPREAIMFIEMIMGQPFNKEAFAALTRIVSQGELDRAA